MDKNKAMNCGTIAGGIQGFGLAAAGTLAIPVIGPVVGCYIVMGAMLGGAWAGGTIGEKIAEKNE